MMWPEGRKMYWKDSSTYVVALCAILFPVWGNLALADCGSVDKQLLGSKMSIQATMEVLRTEENPFHLGFNLEALAFEDAYWQPEASSIETALFRQFDAQPGFVFRYPGGTISDLIDLSAMFGRERKRQKLASWAPPRPLLFGPEEYAGFVKRVEGRAWFVLNAFDGNSDRALPAVLAKRNLSLVSRVLPMLTPLRVELGNEPYQVRHELSGAEYAERILPTLTDLNSHYPEIKPVVALVGFDRGAIKSEKFDREILERVKRYPVEFALHYYYDGPPGGLPLRRTYQDVCEKSEWIRSAGYSSPAIWITEHGRWPGGRTKDPDWRTKWPNTYSLAAALSSSEFVIGMASMPQVKGVFLHSLASTDGPWPMFHRLESTNALVPSAPFLASLLWRTLADGKMMTSRVVSPTRDGSPLLRANVIRRADGSWGVLAVQRSAQEVAVDLELPGLAGKTVRAELAYLEGKGLNSHNGGVEKNVSIRRANGDMLFDSTGKTVLKIPPNSLVQITVRP